MKAIIISFAMLLLLIVETKSQTIPNAGFENWTTDIWDNYNPDYWETNNGDFQPTHITWSYGYQGNWALRAENYWGSSFGGAMFSFAKCKFPAVNHPITLNAYVKSEYLVTDSVNIQIAVYYNGIMVDSGYWLNTNLSPISVWTAISIPITQLSIYADSVEIQINGGVESGTSLYVDDLSFITTGINGNENSCCLTIFPNPTSNELNIQNSFSQPLNFTLYNSSGEKLIDKIITDKTSTINLSAYSNNLYFYQLSNNKQLIKSGKITKQ